MKIQPLSTENRPKAYALLRRAFVGSDYEAELIELFHNNNKPLHEWICVHSGKAIAYIAFSNAFQAAETCGLHLAPMAVAPEFQRQGVGTQLLNFALRQPQIKAQPLFVLGAPNYYRRFGFEPCQQPVCPYDKNNAHFLSLRNPADSPFVIGYEAEFKLAEKSPQPAKSHRSVRSKKQRRR